jgi:hypothetical protein
MFAFGLRVLCVPLWLHPILNLFTTYSGTLTNTMQNDDERTFAARILSKPEPTKKIEEQQLVKFCYLVAIDNQFSEVLKAEANKLYSEWSELQHRAFSSRKEQRAKAKQLEALLKHMEKFRLQNQ